MTSERRTCERDQDCLDTQYCYDVSKSCVNYILCSIYNRVEAKAPARDPYQCGPCMKGYMTDVFATGEAPLCYKKDDDRAVDKAIYVIVAIIMIVLLCVISTVIYINFNKIKNYISRRSLMWFPVQSTEINQNNTTIVNINEETVAPIANAPEQQPFIEKANCNVSPRNNNEMIAHNKFQTARASEAPNWVRYANYGTNILTYPSDEMEISEENRRNSSIQSATVNDDTIAEIPAGPELNIQHDNNFTSLLPTHSSNNSVNEDSEADNDANNGTNLSFQATTNEETIRDKIKSIVINQSIKQNITMNVNVNKDDEF